MTFRLEVEGFGEGRTIPVRHTCDGENLSPAMHWQGAPLKTRSFALIVEDPDAPMGTWNHWLLWDIPVEVQALAEGFKPGRLGCSGRNDFGDHGYGGPCPPRGHGVHRYYFRLYALDVDSLRLAQGSKRMALDQALLGHVLSEASYMGRYQRP